jgi:hypothetical protein
MLLKLLDSWATSILVLSIYWVIFVGFQVHSWITEISVKSGKDSTSTLCLVIHRVRFRKKPAKKYIRIQGVGVETQKTINFLWFPEFHPVATIIPLEPCALNAEFSISYWDLIKFPYFVVTTERGVRGWKEAQRQGEDRVTLRISLMYIPEETQHFFSFCWRIFANFESKKSDFVLNKGFLKSNLGLY